MRVADDVRGHDRLLGILDDAAQRPERGLADGAVDLLDGRCARELDREVDDAPVGHGDAHGEAVEASLELGDHLSDRARRAGGRRDDVGRGVSTASHVLRVGGVDQALVGGVGVDRVEQAAFDPERIVQHLRDRRRAVGRAARVADDARIAVHDVIVHAHHERGLERVLAGHGQDHATGTGVEMFLEVRQTSEDARALDDVVDPELAPRELRRVLFREDQERIPVDVHRAVVDLHGPRVAAVDAVVSKGVAERLGRRDVVDRDDVEVTAELRDPRDGPTDATEAVDRDLGYVHDGPPDVGSLARHGARGAIRACSCPRTRWGGSRIIPSASSPPARDTPGRAVPATGRRRRRTRAAPPER